MNETHRLALLANDESLIVDRTFDGDTLLGPAVIALVEGVTLEHNSFGADPESLFIELAEGKRTVGIIGLKNVRIRNCTITNVAIAGTSGDIARFRHGFQITG